MKAFLALEWKKKHESAAREIFLQHRLVKCAAFEIEGANTMTRDQIRLVQASFRNVLPIREQAAALFYDRLFEIDPGTRGLFADTDLRSQGGKLMAAIGMVVHALDAPESMVGKLKELARRHVNYGVENRHYPTVGAALLWTLQVGLGEAFTPELRDAWASAYNMLSERMMEAAREAAPAHAATNFLGQLAEGRAGTLG